MGASIAKCPQCQAPLTPPSRFARSVVCEYCGASVQLDPSVVSASRYREALKQWNDPSRFGFTSWTTIGGSHWTLGETIARGDSCDVLRADRARKPGERVLIKVVRESAGEVRLNHERDILRSVRADLQIGSFDSRIPEPIVSGSVQGGSYEGQLALVLRWAPGFHHTFEGIRAAAPSGVEPIVSIWMWRRLLEMLAFLHRRGLAHGALIPSHVLVEEGDHGIRLVGYGSAGELGAPLRMPTSHFGAFYPAGKTLSAAVDVCMSARCIAYVLGGDPLPAQVPEPLRSLIQRVASAPDDAIDPWQLREEVGALARTIFGAPSFHPFVMPH